MTNNGDTEKKLKPILKTQKTLTFENLPDMDEDLLVRDDDDDHLPDHSKYGSYQMRKKRYSNASAKNARMSIVSLNTDDPKFTLIASLVVLKILIFDLGVSLADTITDFAQGLYLMYDWNGTHWVKKTDDWLPNQKDAGTFHYGIIVLLANWIPGFVAVIHITAYHRHDFFNQEHNSEKKKGAVKKFLLVIFLCFFFYPIAPTIGYLTVLFQMNVGKKTLEGTRREMFARTAHAIAGCVEAPFQMIMINFLILRGLLDMPWNSFFQVIYHDDRLGNKVATVDIPMISLIFSFLNIISSAIQINIFNIYIIQFQNLESLKKFAILSAGHIPFFILSTSFRLLAYSFMVIYLDFWAAFPVGAIFFANLLIGYASSRKQVLSRDIRRSLTTRIGIIKRNMGREDVPDAKMADKLRIDNKDVPIWLNSFLSIFVPTCYQNGIVPELLHMHNDDSSNPIDLRVFKEQSKFQKKIIRRETRVTTMIILLSVLAIFVGVNFTQLNYNDTILDNANFNIMCGLLVVLGLLNLLLSGRIDILELFGMNYLSFRETEISIKFTDVRTIVNRNTKAADDDDDVVDGQMTIDFPDHMVPEAPVVKQKTQHSMLTVVGVSFVACILLLSPMVGGLLLSNHMTNRCYFVGKVERPDGLQLMATKTNVINGFHDWNGVGSISGKVHVCNAENTWPNYGQARIFVYDLNEDTCWTHLKDRLSSSLGEAGEAISAIVIVGNKGIGSSSPISRKYPELDSRTSDRFPIVLVDDLDEGRIMASANASAGQTPSVTIVKDDLENLLANKKSELYTVDCPELTLSTQAGCVHFFSRTKLFLGCDGNIKKKIEIKLTCIGNGKPCPEVDRFTTKVKYNQVFKDCLEAEGVEDPEQWGQLPAPTCTNSDQSIYDSLKCDSEMQGEVKTNFWKYKDPYGSSCKPEQDEWSTIYRPKICTETKCRGQWGKWSQCGRDRNKYRFCRSGKHCTFMEIKKFSDYQCIDKDSPEEDTIC